MSFDNYSDAELQAELARRRQKNAVKRLAEDLLIMLEAKESSVISVRIVGKANTKREMFADSELHPIVKSAMISALESFIGSEDSR